MRNWLGFRQNHHGTAAGAAMERTRASLLLGIGLAVFALMLAVSAVGFAVLARGSMG